MSADLDLDEMIANGEVEASPDAVKFAKLRLLARAADAAFRSDVSYAVEMAKASWVAKDKQAALLRDESASREVTTEEVSPPAVVKIRAVEVQESPEDRQRRWGRESMRRARAKERAKKAADAPAEREAALARAAAFAASRGL